MISKNSKLKFNFLNSFIDITHKYEYFIFDCDGVIWRESNILQSTVDAIKKLQSEDKKIFFLSNTNKSSRYDMQEKFKQKCGLEINFKNIYTSSYLTSKYISENYPSIKNLYLIGSAGLERELEEKGITIYGGSTNKNIKYIENFTSDILEELEVDQNIHACLCGYDDKFNYFKICYAAHVIHKTGLFFGTNYDRFTRSKNKIAPGSYTFISALEACSEKKAEIVTKPDPRSLNIIFEEHGLNLDFNREKILMIGDNMNTDILFANYNKIDSILVLTGVTSEENLKTLELLYTENTTQIEDHLNSNKIPTYILKEF